MKRIPLYTMAHARSGDKCDGSNVGVLAYDRESFEILRGWLTPERVKKHFKGILAYFETGYTTSMSEGFNNKARLATRRAYGFHSAEAFLAMIELTCPGIPIPLPRSTS